MQVDIDVHDRSGALLARQPQEPVLSTEVYLNQLTMVDVLIERIIQANAGESNGGRL